MRLVVQNVKEAQVKIDGKVFSSIAYGYLILVSFNKDDNEQIIDKMVDKLLHMRVFPDNDNKTNLSIKDVEGEILSVSQFTLYASIKEGRRPSFTNCLSFSLASHFYDVFNEILKNKFKDIKTGIFGADMDICLINEGPFTMILDSKELF